MKKARFTESQIVSILKLADSGMKIDEICHLNRHGFNRHLRVI